jgi:hypothetical protein
LRLHAMGWKSSDIARWLGVSRQLVSKRLEEHDISVREKKREAKANQPPRERKAMGRAVSPKTRYIVQLYREGKGTGELAKMTGLSQNAIVAKIVRHVPKEERRHHKRNREETRRAKARIYAYADDGFSGFQIAQMAGEHESCVYRGLAEREVKS